MIPLLFLPRPSVGHLTSILFQLNRLHTTSNHGHSHPIRRQLHRGNPRNLERTISYKYQQSASESYRRSMTLSRTRSRSRLAGVTSQAPLWNPTFALPRRAGTLYHKSLSWSPGSCPSPSGLTASTSGNSFGLSFTATVSTLRTTPAGAG